MIELTKISSNTSEAQVSEFGGQLVSWRIKNIPILFENPHAILDGSAAIRGGAPICFPYFGKGILLNLEKNSPELSPQHGKARSTYWKIIDKSDQHIELTTNQDAPGTNEDSNIKLTLNYNIESFSENESTLKISGKILNTTSKNSLVQVAVHSYWNCDNPDKINVHGLGPSYLDNLQGLKEINEESFISTYPIPFDRVYLKSQSIIKATFDQFSLSIETQGISNSVAWNPGSDHTLKDLNIPNFCCLESGNIYPAPILKSYEELEFNITYFAVLNQS